ncbi:MAG TPA: hypothetical protein VHZ76_09155 [Gammaproteobacteria bacterium]|jgi:hypothetical protein|nr:hypothetical protein [Gammaproteobacteria bacterium]
MLRTVYCVSEQAISDLASVTESDSKKLDGLFPRTDILTVFKTAEEAQAFANIYLHEKNVQKERLYACPIPIDPNTNYFSQQQMSMTNQHFIQLTERAPLFTVKTTYKDAPIFALEIIDNDNLLQENPSIAVNSKKSIPSFTLPITAVQHVDHVLIHTHHPKKAQSQYVQYGINKSIAQITHKKDTVPYEQAWDCASGGIKHKMIVALEKYKKGSYGGFFRTHKKDANNLIEKLRGIQDEDIAYLLNLVEDESKPNLRNGDYSAVLTVLKINLKKLMLIEESTVKLRQR